MEIELWEAAFGICDAIERAARARRFTQGGRTAADVAPDAIDRSALRARVREALVTARASWAGLMSERDVYRTLFPLVAHLDELMRDPGAQDPSWPPLQEEFFQVSNAGELFFDSLDELLQAPSALRFTLGVYLYCLKLGFKGRHAGRPQELARYQKQLAARVCPPVAGRERRPTELVARPPRRRPAAALYAGAAILLAAAYGALALASSRASAAPPAVTQVARSSAVP